MGTGKGHAGPHCYSNVKTALWWPLGPIQKEGPDNLNYIQRTASYGEGVQNQETWRAREWNRKFCWTRRKYSRLTGADLHHLSFVGFLVWVLSPLLTHSSFWEKAHGLSTPALSLSHPATSLAFLVSSPHPYCPGHRNNLFLKYSSNILLSVFTFAVSCAHTFLFPVTCLLNYLLWELTQHHRFP